MRSRKLPWLLFIMALVLTSSCADSSPTAPSLPAVPQLAMEPSAHTEEGALAEITRLIALAMTEHGMRHRVKEDMRRAPFAEHKLELATYLRGQSGGILFNSMLRHSKYDRDQLLHLLAAVRPLEFYIPVVQHRETWRGEPNILIAGQLRESEAPVAFDRHGTMHFLSPVTAPSIVTFTLVPVETRFDRPLDMKSHRNRNDRNGDAIGTLTSIDGGDDCGGANEALQPCDSSGGPGVGTPPGGLYMNLSSIIDLGESWTKGAPEIEVIVLGPPYHGAEARELTCAGDAQSGYRYFDQNSQTWSGEVLLMTSEELANYRFDLGDEGSAFYVQVWEDDDKRCELVTDKDIGKHLLSLVAYGIAVRGAIRCDHTYGQSLCVIGVIAGTWAGIRTIWSGIKTNDDFVGTAALRTTVNQPGYPDHSHILILNDDGSARNGAINLILR